MTFVAGYCRVSTDREDQANSFSAQQRFFRKYIQQHPDWKLYDIYADEGLSGTDTKNRTQFNRMIADAREGKFQMIITKEISRFSRNILDTITFTRELKNMGIGVLFFTENINTLNSEAEMLLTFMGTIAQEESRRTSIRVKWGQSRQMERGVVFGPPLLGYQVQNGKISIVPEEAELIRLIFHKYGRERKGTTVIARELQEVGYETGQGNREWNPGSILKILKNEKYVGDLVQRKSITPDYLTHRKTINHGQEPLIIQHDHHEPIVSRELWDMVQEEIRRRKRTENQSAVSRKCIFSGKIYCGECGCVYVSRYKYLKDGGRIRRWSCSAAARQGREVCDVGKLLREDDALDMVKTAFRSLKISFDTYMGRMEQILRQASTEGKRGESQLRALDMGIQKLAKKKTTALDAFLSGEISREELDALKENYETQLTRLKSRREEISEGQQPDYSEIRRQMNAFLSGEQESETLYSCILRDITVFKDRHMELRLVGLPHIFRFEESSKID